MSSSTNTPTPPRNSSGLVSNPSPRQKKLTNASSAPPIISLPSNKKYHGFLTHNWQEDEEGRNNHARVERVHLGLKKRGLNMWFDSERMTGAIVDQMIKGIDESDLVIVFITKKYCQKVASGNPKDNCRKEFMYTSQNKGATKMIPIPMEPCMMNPLSWVGVVNMELGGLLYEASFPTDDDVKFEENIDNLFKQIVRETGASIPQQKSGSSSRAAVTTENPQVSQEAATSKSAISTQIDPLSDELVSFLTAAKVKVSDQLTTAFNNMGIVGVDDFDDLDDEMTAALEGAMKPMEKKRFRRSLVGRNQSAAVLEQVVKETVSVISILV